MPDSLQYDRSRRPLEFWSAMLAMNRHPAQFSEDDLEAALSLALECCQEGASPATKALALYVVGRCLMLLRYGYPNWSEWLAHATVVAADWAWASGEPTYQKRSEALFSDYVNLLKRHQGS
jgi:hypothetical protein